jgi:hypothetical protein
VAAASQEMDARNVAASRERPLATGVEPTGTEPPGVEATGMEATGMEAAGVGAPVAR